MGTERVKITARGIVYEGTIKSKVNNAFKFGPPENHEPDDWYVEFYCDQETYESGAVKATFEPGQEYRYYKQWYDGGKVEFFDAIQEINLDCYTICTAELEKLAGGPGLTENQRWYVMLKARAMRARLEGSINAALRLEDRCEAIYKRMREEERW